MILNCLIFPNASITALYVSISCLNPGCFSANLKNESAKTPALVSFLRTWVTRSGVNLIWVVVKKDWIFDGLLLLLLLWVVINLQSVSASVVIWGVIGFGWFSIVLLQKFFELILAEIDECECRI